MPRTDSNRSDRSADYEPVITNSEVMRHIEFYEDRTVRAGVILQIGGTSIAMSGIEFFNLLKAAKSYGRDWGAGDRPNRADIAEAIRVLKSGGGR